MDCLKTICLLAILSTAFSQLLHTEHNTYIGIYEENLQIRIFTNFVKDDTRAAKRFFVKLNSIQVAVGLEEKFKETSQVPGTLKERFNASYSSQLKIYYLNIYNLTFDDIYTFTAVLVYTKSSNDRLLYSTNVTYVIEDVHSGPIQCGKPLPIVTIVYNNQASSNVSITLCGNPPPRVFWSLDGVILTPRVDTLSLRKYQYTVTLSKVSDEMCGRILRYDAIATGIELRGTSLISVHQSESSLPYDTKNSADLPQVTITTAYRIESCIHITWTSLDDKNCLIIGNEVEYRTANASVLLFTPVSIRTNKHSYCAPDYIIKKVTLVRVRSIEEKRFSAWTYKNFIVLTPPTTTTTAKVTFTPKDVTTPTVKTTTTTLKAPTISTTTPADKTTTTSAAAIISTTTSTDKITTISAATTISTTTTTDKTTTTSAAAIISTTTPTDKITTISAATTISTTTTTDKTTTTSAAPKISTTTPTDKITLTTLKAPTISTTTPTDKTTTISAAPKKISTKTPTDKITTTTLKAPTISTTTPTDKTTTTSAAATISTTTPTDKITTTSAATTISTTTTTDNTTTTPAATTISTTTTTDNTTTTPAATTISKTTSTDKTIATSAATTISKTTSTDKTISIPVATTISTTTPTDRITTTSAASKISTTTPTDKTTTTSAATTISLMTLSDKNITTSAATTISKTIPTVKTTTTTLKATTVETSFRTLITGTTNTVAELFPSQIASTIEINRTPINPPLSNETLLTVTPTTLANTSKAESRNDKISILVKGGIASGTVVLLIIIFALGLWCLPKNHWIKKMLVSIFKHDQSRTAKTSSKSTAIEKTVPSQNKWKTYKNFTYEPNSRASNEYIRVGKLGQGDLMRNKEVSFKDFVSKAVDEKVKYVDITVHH